jgi:hypothetical protein
MDELSDLNSAAATLACIASVQYEDRGSIRRSTLGAGVWASNWWITNWAMEVPPFLGPVHERTSRPILGVAAR